MTDDETLKDGEEAEGEVLPPPTALTAEEADEPDDAHDFMEGFGDDNLDPEEADAIAMGYKVKAHGDDEDDEGFFSADEE